MGEGLAAAERGPTPRVGRRRLLRSAAAALIATGSAVAGAEWLALRGRFDHRRLQPPSGGARFDRSMRRLRSAELAQGALVHVGHSTHLLSVAGRRLLTDPWFYDPAFGALEHSPAPAVTPERIGALDAILISHDHPDHADPAALDRLDKTARVITTRGGLPARLRALGFRAVETLAPWEQLMIGGATVTAVPALHDVEEIGFVVSGTGRSVYFAGDTALHGEWEAIRERLRPRVALLPVDGTRIVGQRRLVMNAAEAIRAAELLGSELVLPTHAQARLASWGGRLLAETTEGADAGLVRRCSDDTRGRRRCEALVPGQLVPL